MNQEQISKIVFSFNKSITDIDIFEEKDFQYNFLRDAIKSAPNMKEIPNSYLPSFQLFQIKKGITMSKDGKKRCTLQFIDISKQIFYSDIKAQEEYASLMNSTVSHEMRNPLNSIINQCLIQENSLREMSKLKLGKKVDKFLKEIEMSNNIQKNSSQMLLFHVEDVLGMAQLKAGKFRKNETKFNIKKAVNDIIEIQ